MTTTYPRPIDPDLDDWATIEEAADHVDIATDTLRRYIARGYIPHKTPLVRTPTTKPRKSTCVRLTDLENYYWTKTPRGRTRAIREEYAFFRDYCGWGDLRTTHHLARHYNINHTHLRITLTKDIHARKRTPSHIAER